MRTYKYMGIRIYPSGVNSSGLRWWALHPLGGQLRADTLKTMRELIKDLK